MASRKIRETLSLLPADVITMELVDTVRVAVETARSVAVEARVCALELAVATKVTHQNLRIMPSEFLHEDYQLLGSEVLNYRDVAKFARDCLIATKRCLQYAKEAKGFCDDVLHKYDAYRRGTGILRRPLWYLPGRQGLHMPKKAKLGTVRKDWSKQKLQKFSVKTVQQAIIDAKGCRRNYQSIFAISENVAKTLQPAIRDVAEV